MDALPALNRQNLKVARENMGLSSRAASKKISSSKKDLIAKWESGDAVPTWSHITKLAKAYNVSELLFFSEKTIEKNKIVPDYRVGVDAESDENVKKLVNLVETRQRWLEKNLKGAGWSKNRLLGSGKHLRSPKELARFIGEKLSIDLGEVKEISGRKNALNYLIKKAELGGIFVGKTVAHHRLEVDDLRGLFVSNDYCPFIVLNRRDALSAQIFSFVHELAHFFRRSDAISNSLEFRNAHQGVNPEEIFCNKVAAELLLPEQDFTKKFYDKADIDSISEAYKVSKIFIFYRLKELGKIRRDIQAELEREITKEMKESLKKKAEKDAASKGGNYTNAMKDSNGELFNRVVSNSYLENKIGYIEASNLLRFSPEKV
jgi:Zn-dependent peptidase ImmA (M78 family)/transcriptional regulator with XRE-family HTH domain